MVSFGSIQDHRPTVDGVKVVSDRDRSGPRPSLTSQNLTSLDLGVIKSRTRFHLHSPFFTEGDAGSAHAHEAVAGRVVACVAQCVEDRLFVGDSNLDQRAVEMSDENLILHGWAGDFAGKKGRIRWGAVFSIFPMPL